jgi:hypothetical protein
MAVGPFPHAQQVIDRERESLRRIGRGGRQSDLSSRAQLH